MKRRYNGDRELNRLKELEAQEKAIQSQIKQLIETSRLTERGDLPFRFTHESKIRTMLVESAQQKALVSGKLAIAVFAQGYEIVPRTVADKIAQRDEKLIVLCNSLAADADDNTDVEDDYADYQVPDDLMW